MVYLFHQHRVEMRKILCRGVLLILSYKATFDVSAASSLETMKVKEGRDEDVKPVWGFVWWIIRIWTLDTHKNFQFQHYNIIISFMNMLWKWNKNCKLLNFPFFLRYKCSKIDWFVKHSAIFIFSFNFVVQFIIVISHYAKSFAYLCETNFFFFYTLLVRNE